MADRRRALLTAALGFLRFEQRTPALRALHTWLDNWRGVGLVIDGMRRQSYDVSLRTFGVDDGRWVASFHSHPMTSVDGFATAATPWGAVQRAACRWRHGGWRKRPTRSADHQL